jgi:hypothetical protein
MTLENYVEKLERTKKKNDRNDHRAYSTQWFNNALCEYIIDHEDQSYTASIIVWFYLSFFVWYFLPFDTRWCGAAKAKHTSYVLPISKEL